MCISILCTLILLSALSFVLCNFEGHVVGGRPGSILDFPHSTFVAVECHLSRNKIEEWICGGSILNQDIVLTAAHCMEDCSSNTRIIVMTGHEDNTKGFKSSVHSYIMHEKYQKNSHAFDIGLLRLTTQIEFGPKRQRVVLLQHPPYDEAQTAAWGLVDEEKTLHYDELQYVTQNILDRNKCSRIVKKLHASSFCAQNTNKNRYVSYGDSGSALMVHNYIQIGIVSYKLPEVANHVAVYTNVSYFLPWIRKYSVKLACSR